MRAVLIVLLASCTVRPPQLKLWCAARQPLAGMTIENHTDRWLHRAGIDAEINRTLTLWRHALLMEGATCDPEIVLAGTRIVVVDPPLVLRGALVSGIAWPGKPWRIDLVLYSDDYESSALGHEIGHVLAVECLDAIGNPALKALHVKHGVPY